MWRFSSIKKLFRAFKQSDGLRRSQRVKRELWCAKHLTFQASFTVDHSLESSRMEQEARECFVNGNFIAAHILAISFCEHTLSDWLLSSGTIPDLNRNRKTLAFLATEAQKVGLFDAEFWNEFTQQRELRNAYVHRVWSAPTNSSECAKLAQNSLTTRFKQSKLSPELIVESDAMSGLLLMDRMRHLRHKSGITKNPLDEL